MSTRTRNTGGTTRTTARDRAEDAGAFRLVVLFGPGAGLARTLGTSSIEIGREPNGADDVELDDPELSRRHAVLEPVDQGLRLRDLNSHNGTYVNGLRVVDTEVDDGDLVRVGGHLLLIQYVTLAEAELLGARETATSLVGGSVAMRALRARIRALAPVATPLLIAGETGSGKELVARELHEASGRTGPLVPVNCAALPEALAESELFGHVRGAFTGATSPSQGLFGAAEGGTLLLDEIGEMPDALQAKLLRALATGEVRAVGDTRARHVDVRVIGATHVDLAGAVTAGKFRADLYARLAGATVEVPPLRDRRDDVLTLFRHFAGRPVELSPDAAEALVLHGWPFNVRELEHTTRLVTHGVSGTKIVQLGDLPPAIGDAVRARHALPPGGSKSGEIPIELRIARDRAPNADELREVIAHFEGNMERVAQFFGRDRKQAYRWLRRHGIDPRVFRRP